MSTTITPPPVPPVPPVPPAAGPPPQAPQPRSSARVIAILAIVVGAVLILGAVTTSAFAAMRTAGNKTESLTADATGVTALDVDIEAAGFRLEYGSDDATLAITGGSGAADWRLERRGDTLVVRSDRDWWSGWCWGGFNDDERVVLALPDQLRDTALDAAFDLGAGSIDADGTFGVLELDLGAGSIDVTGTAEELNADISAGRTSLDLDGVRTAVLRISAGSINGELDGPLTDLAIDLSAGRVALTVPDQTYDITQDVSAGSFNHDLDTSSSARNTISVDVSAGSAELNAAR